MRAIFVTKVETSKGLSEAVIFLLKKSWELASLLKGDTRDALPVENTPEDTLVVHKHVIKRKAIMEKHSKRWPFLCGVEGSFLTSDIIGRGDKFGHQSLDPSG